MSDTPRYVVWDKVTPVITPVGEVMTPEQWIERYPAAQILKTVLQGGEINGAFFGYFNQMVQMAETDGCDFTGCETDQDYLDAIEAFEDARNVPSDDVTPEERIAAALEYQNLMEY